MGAWPFSIQTAWKSFKRSSEIVIRPNHVRGLTELSEARPRMLMQRAGNWREPPSKAHGSGKTGLVRKDNSFRSSQSRLAHWKGYSALIKRKECTGCVF